MDRVERHYLVRCGSCGFLGGPDEGMCARCGYDGVDPASEGAEYVRLPAIHAQRDEEWRERLRERIDKLRAKKSGEVTAAQDEADCLQWVLDSALSHLDKKGDS